MSPESSDASRESSQETEKGEGSMRPGRYDSLVEALKEDRINPGATKSSS
jgi:hypothetical protein